MNLLPQTYLLGLVGLLAIVAVVVGRQFLRVRRDEARLIELEKSDTASSRQASDLYELGSVQLRKRLYPQAAATLKQALKRLSGEPDEARAVIENALHPAHHSGVSGPASRWLLLADTAACEVEQIRARTDQTPDVTRPYQISRVQ